MARIVKAARVAPGQGKKKPPGGNPTFASRLVFLADFTRPGRVVDLVSGMISTINKTHVATPWGPAGRGMSFPNAATGHLAFTSGPYTFVVFLHMNAEMANGEYLGLLDRSAYVSESNNTGYLIILRAPNDSMVPGISNDRFNFQVFGNNGLANYAGTFRGLSNAGSEQPGLGRFLLIAESDGSVRRPLIARPGTHQAYPSADAWPASPSTYAANLNPNASAADLTNNVVHVSAKGETYYIALFKGLLSSYEKTQLRANPWIVAAPYLDFDEIETVREGPGIGAVAAVLPTTTTLTLVSPNPVPVAQPVSLAATVEGPVGPWGTALFQAAVDGLQRTAALPANAGPWTMVLDVRIVAGTGGFQTILGLGTTSYLFIAANSSLALYAETGNSSATFSGPGFTFTPGQWHTIAIVRGATANSYAIYVDDMTTPRLTATGALGNAFTVMEWGAFGGSNLHRLNGYVRRLLWWSAIRSSAELAAQIPAGEALVRTNLAGEYLFGTGDGADTSGNSRTLTIDGAPSLVPGPQGDMIFLATGAPVDTVPVDLGVAALEVGAGFSPAGDYDITAEYVPADALRYEGSVSAPETLVVEAGGGGGAAGLLWLRRRRRRR